MFVRRIKTIATKPVCSWFFAYSLIVFGFITPAVAQNPSQYVTHTAIACICRAFIPGRNWHRHDAVPFSSLHSPRRLWRELLYRLAMLRRPRATTGMRWKSSVTSCGMLVACRPILHVALWHSLMLRRRHRNYWVPRGTMLVWLLQLTRSSHGWCGCGWVRPL